MSKIHYFQRYSSKENTVTNNTLQLLARIYDYSPTKAVELLNALTGEEIEIGIGIEQQQRIGCSVPDGIVKQESFRIIIESKVGSAPSVNQLVEHANSFLEERQKILLLLTREKISCKKEREIQEKLSNKKQGVMFRNITYEEICEAISDLFENHEHEMVNLVDDYVTYCNEMQLIEQTKYLMRIVPCGTSFDLNKKHGIYFHPSDRGYTRFRYLGVYKNKLVHILWELDCVVDVALKGENLEKTLVEGCDTSNYDNKIRTVIKEAKTKCGYDIKVGHRFFCGEQVYQTEFKKASKGGMQGSRCINLKHVLGGKDVVDNLNVQEIAEKLKGKVWN